MSFDEIQFPLRVGYGSKGGPCFSTDVVVVAGGYERRNQNWSQARRSFDARSGLHSAEDASTLLSFFHARAGRARGFRLRDWSDYSSATDNVSPPSCTDQNLGQGDGVKSVFALIKNYAGFDHKRRITKPVAESVCVAIDGQEQASGWSVDTTTGLVSFAAPPNAGQIVTAGFLFDVPVRFDTDMLSLSRENYSAYDVEIPLIEIRV